MMIFGNSAKTIGCLTFLLAVIGGYCDTLTFVAGDGIFSAHVTGNFVVFAAQVASGSGEGSWVKLISFPIFIVTVMIGGRLAGKLSNKYNMLVIESLLLLLAGILGILLPHFSSLEAHLCMYTSVMITVVALGFQNAFGKMFAKETHGPTTMMTGNVTQASLDLSNVLKGGQFRVDGWNSLKKQMVTISGFLVGCLFGAWMGKCFGLGLLLAPGLILFIFCLLFKRESK
jgi:uncharacterized membrane protein YoaK (UPF0700 family)